MIAMGLLVAILTFSQVAVGQIGFGLYTTDDIQLTKNQDLDFGTIEQGAQDLIMIALQDNEVVAIEIDAIAYMDITVTITPPTNNYIVFMGDENNLADPSKRLAVDIQMAYYNRGPNEVTITHAQQNAIPLSGEMISFQVMLRPGGPPGPPPTPPSGNYTPPRAKAYLFIYGSLTPGDVLAGPYSGIIDVHVEYTTTYEPNN